MTTQETTTVPVELVPYVENDSELFEDELSEVSEPSADAIFTPEEASRNARVWEAKNPCIHYKRDFLWLAPYLNGEKCLPDWVGVDIETEVEDRPDIGPGWRSGLNPVHTAIACIQIEISGDVYIVHWSPPEFTGTVRPPGNMGSVNGIGLFRELCERPYVWKCIHNAEFEWKFLINELGHEFVINSVWDTKLGENVLSEGRGFTLTQGKYWVPKKDEKPKKFLGLGDCIRRRYGYEMDKGLDVRLSFMRGDSLTDRQLHYAGDDAVWCRMLAEDQYADMERHEEHGVRMLTTMIADCEMVEAVGRMALNGIHVDKYEAQKLWAEIEYEITQTTERVRKLLWLPGDDDPVLTPKTGKQRVKDGKPVYNLLNLNSEQQMVPRLQKFGVEVADYTAASLKHFKDHACVSDILHVKVLDKLRGTYLQPIVTRFLHPKTHRVYFELNLAGTTTGRLSSAKPNLQNQPSRTKEGKAVRRLFKATPGNKLIEADFSNIELKIISEVYGDDNMINAFCSGMDLHALIGAVVLYGIEDFTWANLVEQYNIFYPKYKEGDPEHASARQGGKPVNFGLGYGAGPKELQMIAWRDHGIWWDLPTCKKLRSLWLSIWSGVRAYHYSAARMCEDAARLGRPVIAETIDGRRRWIDARTGYSAWLNHRIQGCLRYSTRVMTNRGYLRIGDLANGVASAEYVWDGTGWRTYTVLSRGSAQAVDVRLSDGRTIECDDRHEFFRHAGGGNPAKVTHVRELKYRTKICAPKFGVPIEFDRKFEPFFWSGSAHNSRPVAITNEDQLEEAWYWAGYLTGDGNIFRLPNKTTVDREAVTCSFGYNHKIEYYKRFAAWADSLGLTCGEPRDSKTAIGRSFQATIPSSGLVCMLEWLGMVPNAISKTKRVPERLFTETTRNRYAFVRGLHESDGDRRTKSLHLMNRDLLSDVQQLYDTLGMAGHLSPTYKDGSALLTFRVLGGSRFYDPRYSALEVREVTYLPWLEETYTLAVDHEDHRFVSNGVISKNTSADMTKRAINEMKRDVNIILTVHDSIMAEVPEHEAEDTARYMSDVMIRAGQYYLKRVPVTVDTKIMDRWEKA